MPTIYLGNVLGATGPSGPIGPTGPAGEDGATGQCPCDDGATGPTGAVGPTGPSVSYVGSSSDTIDLSTLTGGNSLSFQLFEVADSLSYTAGSNLRVYSNNSSIPGDENYFVGLVSNYSGTVVTVVVELVVGTSESNDWGITLDG